MSNVILRSKDRTNYNNTSSSDFELELKEPIESGVYQLVYGSIPNTFYNVPSTNNMNKFVIFETDTEYTITITPGNYTASSLATELETQLDASAATNTFTVTYSSATGKLTFTTNTSDVEFRFGTYQYDSAEILGFNFETFTATTGGNEAPNVVNLAHQHAFICEVNHINNFYSSSNSNNMSFYIPFDVGASDVLTFKQDHQFKQTIRFFQNENHIKIILRDSESRLVDLNGANFELVIQKIE